MTVSARASQAEIRATLHPRRAITKLPSWWGGDLQRETPVVAARRHADGSLNARVICTGASVMLNVEFEILGSGEHVRQARTVKVGGRGWQELEALLGIGLPDAGPDSLQRIRQALATGRFRVLLGARVTDPVYVHRILDRVGDR